ncbi:prefoldin subunit 2 [Fusarium albosuccineum]|uniref:Prefoldin subunit 2 n=1 Tax=Fusarium albosuccineum TaxID=1237068 RepID=A0A8H4LR26_9HYPO|nr:prefoldin subunit 2 [Fusarium albosuccineum]KAF4989012.1 hypothetical protein FDECE_14835 [Fusarium decemcellulare]
MSSAQVPARKQQDLQATYSNYKNTLQQIAQKIGDIEQEAEEHKLVLETLEPLSGDRKCFRLINGVLVERTVQDVVPALKTNQEGLRKVLDDLVKQYKTKQDDLEKWKSGFNLIKTGSGPSSSSRPYEVPSLLTCMRETLTTHTNQEDPRISDNSPR